MNALHRLASLLVTALLVVGCASHAPVPVIDRTATLSTVERTTAVAAAASAATDAAANYVVRKGDTLYGIALDHGQDYKDLAAWNNLDNPNLIRTGQTLRLSAPDSGGSTAAPASAVAVVKPIAAPAQIEVKPVSGAPVGSSTNTDSLKREPKGGKFAYSEAALARLREVDGLPAIKSADPALLETKPVEKPLVAADESVDWAWPLNGKVQAGFVDGSTKGIDIPGKIGDPVLAAAPGKVVYAGSGLRGYGKLLIVRHTTDFLSAYAHNSQLLVKEGQVVTRGQKIAEVGNSDTDSTKLHFEIRRQGKPVDPMKYLPAR